MTLPRRIPYRIIAAVAFGLALYGCNGSNPLKAVAGFIGGTAPAQPTPGTSATYDTLTSMSWAFVVPGIIMLGLSYWLPPLRQIGGVFAVGGVVLAVVPWVLDTSHLAVLIVTIGGACLLVGTFAAWLWFQIRTRWRIRQVQAALESAPNGDKAKHAGAKAALLRVVNPAIDKAFRKGTRQVDTGATA